jgi:hypothetical protein
MKPIAFTSGLLLLVSFSLAGCSDITSPGGADDVEVTVKVSNTNYDQASFRDLFPDSSSLRSISIAFNSNYSERRRTALVVNMLAKVSAMGEDVVIVDTILTRACCKTPGEYILPTYAERAEYNGKRAWLVQFTYGLSGPQFGRSKCFAFSIPNLDTLNYIGAR